MGPGILLVASVRRMMKLLRHEQNAGLRGGIILSTAERTAVLDRRSASGKKKVGKRRRGRIVPSEVSRGR